MPESAGPSSDPTPGNRVLRIPDPNVVLTLPAASVVNRLASSPPIDPPAHHPSPPTTDPPPVIADRMTLARSFPDPPKADDQNPGEYGLCGNARAPGSPFGRPRRNCGPIPP